MMGFYEKINGNVSKVIIGKEEVVKLMCAAFLSGGHVLLHDLPGSGKTKLAQALSKTLGLEFGRIQFTPDLLPTDVTGLNAYNPKTGDFELKKGPVFTNILLADEINRATPRTQAGLLECMQEAKVTIDGVTYALPQPYIVIATENPIESAGTYPLPEAQLDRFMMRLFMGSLSAEEEVQVLRTYDAKDPLDELGACVSPEEIQEAKNAVKLVKTADCILKYIADIAVASRTHSAVRCGISTRGTIALLNAAKAYAYLDGRDYVIPDDIKALAVPVCAHRLVLGHNLSQDAKDVILEVLDMVKAPTEDF